MKKRLIGIAGAAALAAGAAVIPLSSAHGVSNRVCNTADFAINGGSQFQSTRVGFAQNLGGNRNNTDPDKAFIARSGQSLVTGFALGCIP